MSMDGIYASLSGTSMDHDQPSVKQIKVNPRDDRTDYLFECPNSVVATEFCEGLKALGLFPVSHTSGSRALVSVTTPRPARPSFYILDGRREPVPCNDIGKWGSWFERHKKAGKHRLAHSELVRNGNKCYVSTVFLGLDHAISGPPILFETMVFNGPMDGHQIRYHTREEALAGHWEVVRQAEAELEALPAREEK